MLQNYRPSFCFPKVLWSPRKPEYDGKRHLLRIQIYIKGKLDKMEAHKRLLKVNVHVCNERIELEMYDMFT